KAEKQPLSRSQGTATNANEIKMPPRADLSNRFIESRSVGSPAIELTRRRESKHPPPPQVSCETRPGRPRPTIYALLGMPLSRLRSFEARNGKCSSEREPRVRDEQNDFNDMRAANETINEYRQYGHTTKQPSRSARD